MKKMSYAKDATTARLEAEQKLWTYIEGVMQNRIRNANLFYTVPTTVDQLGEVDLDQDKEYQRLLWAFYVADVFYYETHQFAAEMNKLYHLLINTKEDKRLSDRVGKLLYTKASK